ncbi:hypothetical protein [Methanohalobium sp.]|uniref:hypothetical protein n=1 Tax=Methanohalobium sp. TaxID=2837493 RepID=UPI0025CB9102|nr:hypothetical protein [Methanohalobium sp.]
MKIIKSLTIALVLLLSLVSFTVAAEQPPEPPLIVKGEVEINGEPAPEGTQITAKLNGELIAKSTVEKPGEYELHLLKKDDYTGITFTVDGTESQPDSEIADKLNNADPTKATYLDLSVTQSNTNNQEETQVSVPNSNSGSGGGGFASPSGSDSSTTNQDDDNTASTGDSETRETTAGDNNPDADASTGTNDASESQESTASEPEETSNISLMVVGAIIIVGIIAAVGYKMKK